LVRQDYRYLLDYTRLFAVADARADDEAATTHLLGAAHRVLDEKLELHRSFAADYGIPAAELERVEKAPTCVACTNFLLRTACEGSIAEIAAALFPCMQGWELPDER
jgi:thiaminase/transcriptional activator TenA